MNRLRILLADDHESFRSILASFLRTQPGIEVVGEAVDGEEAIDMSDQLRPDLVLMDVHMPRRNGIEATRTIKVLNPHTKVIMMSADSSEVYQRNARMVADGFIPKASMKMRLLALIANEQSRYASVEAA